MSLRLGEPAKRGSSWEENVCIQNRPVKDFAGYESGTHRKKSGKIPDT